MEREESIGAQWNQGREKLYKVRRGDWSEGKPPEFATWHLLKLDSPPPTETGVLSTGVGWNKLDIFGQP